MTEAATLKKACAQCPWRLSNHGKKHAGGFYTKTNLKRLWNQLRGGGKPQSCHLTDPSHPDHIASGCRPGAEARECTGSVLVVLREIKRMANAENYISAEETKKYLVERKKHGLTKHGLKYWIIDRIQLGGVPLFGGPKIPEVDEDTEVGLPEYLRED